MNTPERITPAQRRNTRFVLAHLVFNDDGSVSKAGTVKACRAACPIDPGLKYFVDLVTSAVPPAAFWAFGEE